MRNGIGSTLRGGGFRGPPFSSVLLLAELPLSLRMMPRSYIVRIGRVPGDCRCRHSSMVVINFAGACVETERLIALLNVVVEC